MQSTKPGILDRFYSSFWVWLLSILGFIGFHVYIPSLFARIHKITGGLGLLDTRLPFQHGTFLAWSGADAATLLTKLGPQGREIYATFTQYNDMVFSLLLAPLLFVGIFWALFGKKWCFLGLVTPLFDTLENITMLQLLQQYPTQPAFAIQYGPLFTSLKALFLVLTVGLILFGLVRKLLVGGWFSAGDFFLAPPTTVYEKGGILITGASRGIGKHTALALDKCGYTVFAGVRKEADGEALKAEASERLVPVILDQTRPALIEAAKQRVIEVMEERGETFFGVACNAGITYIGPMETTPMDKYRQIMEVNYFGTIAVIKAFLPMLRENRGRVIITGAPEGPFPQYTAKSGCNWGLLGLTRSMRAELAGFGVSVSLVTPAGIKTDIYANMPTLIDNAREQMTPEQQTLYPAPSMGNFEGMFDPGWVSRAFVHGFSSSHPRTRYSTTPMGTIIYILSQLLSDRQLETIINKRFYG